jgi:polar amino acid transport system substrate-binding protein
MRLHDWLYAGIVGMILVGCAGPQTGPSPEAKLALTPTGKLRVAFVSTSIYVARDPASGEQRGVAIDLGQELARRLGVPFSPVVISNVSALIGAAKAGDFDVAFMGFNAERATAVDFAAPYMEVELGYLVGAGAPIAGIADVDKSGVRVDVLEKGGSDLELSRTLKNAVLVRAASAAELYSLPGAGKADVIAATKTALFIEADKLPGSRVLEGRFLVEPIGAGVPKGRNAAAAAYVGDFVEQAKADGLVRSAIERAGLRGVVVAPPR